MFSFFMLQQSYIISVKSKRPHGGSPITFNVMSFKKNCCMNLNEKFYSSSVFVCCGFQELRVLRVHITEGKIGIKNNTLSTDKFTDVRSIGM